MKNLKSLSEIRHCFSGARAIHAAVQLVCLCLRIWSSTFLWHTSLLFWIIWWSLTSCCIGKSGLPPKWTSKSHRIVLDSRQSISSSTNVLELKVGYSASLWGMFTCGLRAASAVFLLHQKPGLGRIERGFAVKVGTWLLGMVFRDLNAIMRYLEILRKESFYVIGCAISYFGPQAAVEMTLSIVSKCFALLRSDPHGRLWLDFTAKFRETCWL